MRLSSVCASTWAEMEVVHSTCIVEGEGEELQAAWLHSMMPVGFNVVP